MMYVKLSLFGKLCRFIDYQDLKGQTNLTSLNVIDDVYPYLSKLALFENLFIIILRNMQNINIIKFNNDTTTIN